MRSVPYHMGEKPTMDPICFVMPTGARTWISPLQPCVIADASSWGAVAIAHIETAGCNLQRRRRVVKYNSALSWRLLVESVRLSILLPSKQM